MQRWLLGLVVMCLMACGDDDGGSGTGGSGGNGGSGGSGGAEVCETDDDCDDGRFCNGEESCDADNDDADESGCVAGTAPSCDDGISCTTDTCSNTANVCLHSAPDGDGDGHGGLDCLNEDGDPIGDDCDDDDDTRFPGNQEICDNVDNDCDPDTLGLRDDDGDGAINELCCNPDENGDPRCGSDCNDDNVGIHGEQPEFCDEIDNDCDDAIDEVQNAIPWYRDEDIDGIGMGTDVIESCWPQPDRSPVGTDCDDELADVRPGVSEDCDDNIDNNCNGVINEFCDSDEVSEPLPYNECINAVDDCDENATCSDSSTGFTCMCRFGYSGDGTTCSEPTSCDESNGGCDSLTMCNDGGGTVNCSTCPYYYIGTGRTGCAPTLYGLGVGNGYLQPSFNPEVTSYTVELYSNTSTISFTPYVPGPQGAELGATARINGELVATNDGMTFTWTSDELAVGEITDFQIEVRQTGHPSRFYTVHVSRPLSTLCGGGNCDLNIDNTCGADMACRYALPTNGTIPYSSCVAEGNVAEGQPCTGDAQCAQGMACSMTNGSGVCRQYCCGIGMVSGCPMNQSCQIALLGSTSVGLCDTCTTCGPRMLEFAPTTGTLEPAFDPDTLEYTLSVPASATTISATIDLAGTDAEGVYLGATNVGTYYYPSNEGTPWTSAAISTDVDWTLTVYRTGYTARAYVFHVRRVSAFPLEAFAKASSTDSQDYFGRAIAISGDTMVVGAPLEDSGATGINGDDDDDSITASGAVYVFVRSGTTWTQQAYIKASNASDNDNFGTSLALDGNTLVVGAPYEDSASTNQGNNAATDAGAAYVFVRSGTTWTQQAYLKPTTIGSGDYFGGSVSVSGNTIAVGAYRESSDATGINGVATNDNAYQSGAAYVFVRSGTAWSQQAYLKASNTEQYDYFGTSVAVSGDSIVVGATGEDSDAVDVGGAQGNTMGYDEAGAAYVFVRSGTTWSQQAYVKASNSEQYDHFGQTIAIAGNTLVVGAPDEDSASNGVNGNQFSNVASARGAAYVFVRTGTAWAPQAYLKPDAATMGSARFGASVAINGDVIAAGAPSGDRQYTGAAYLFTRSAGTWTAQNAVIAEDIDSSYPPHLGGSVGVSDTTLVVGAPDESSSGMGVITPPNNHNVTYSGAVYVFRID